MAENEQEWAHAQFNLYPASLICLYSSFFIPLHEAIPQSLKSEVPPCSNGSRRSVPQRRYFVLQETFKTQALVVAKKLSAIWICGCDR